MANIFLDTNILIDLYGRNSALVQGVNLHRAHVSPLSLHILCYVQKIDIPNEKLNVLLENIGVVDLSHEILSRSLKGPTPDIEDNIQLHSAVNAQSEYFLTSDKKLLKMGYFGQMQIVDKL